MRRHPQVVEAERALLGGLLQEPTQLDDVAAVVRPDAFYVPEHARLFELLLQMHANGEAIDLVTVPERALRDDQDDRYGGVTYLLDLPKHAPATTNLSVYAEMVREKATLRDVIQTVDELKRDAFSHALDPGQLLERASAELVRIGEGEARRFFEPVSTVVDGEIARIERLSLQSGEVTGLSTGFLDLDKKLAGLHPTDLLILAARPAMGKTALALNLALNAAHGELNGERAAIGIFSLEMGRGQLVTRLLCCLRQVDAGRVRTGNLDERDWENLLLASEELRELSIHIDDTPGVTISDVRARARRLKAAQPNLGLIVIDYLQLMQGDDPKAPRQQQISEISRGLKILAKDLDVPVLALSQLNRAVEQRADKRPMVSDLRESGAIEQDADIIMFIYRDEIYNPETAEKGLAEVIIGKQRNGPTGTVKLVFQGEFARFDNLAGQEFDDWPDG